MVGPVRKFEGQQIHAGFKRTRDSRQKVHLLSLLPTTSLIPQVVVDGNTVVRTLVRSGPIDYRVQLEVSAFLALQHLNALSGQVLPELPTLLQSCDVEFTMEMRDSEFLSIVAVRQLLLSLQGNATEQPAALQLPTAIIGDARSAVSEVIAVLGGVYEIPQISSSSTSGALDNKDIAPFFARTIPTNAGDARAIIAYFGQLQVSNFAVLYVNDDYGNFYAQYLNNYASANGLRIEFIPFQDSVQSSIEAGILQLQQSGLRYVVGVFDPSTWRQVAKAAYHGGVMGQPGYTWLLSDAALEITQHGFHLNRSSELDIAHAIQGCGVVSLSVNTYTPFDEALLQFYRNKTLQKEFISNHPDFQEFDVYNFTFTETENSSTNSLLYQYLTYDAVIAMGLAVCSTQPNGLTGPHIYQTLRDVQFLGTSGLVRFSNKTGTRLIEDVSYSIQNVLQVASQHDGDIIQFTAEVTAQINPNCDDSSNNCSIKTIKPFIYADNTTSPPPPLPPLDGNLNLIPQGIRILGWAMCAFLILVCVGWTMWTYQYRNKDVVRASQPIFLALLCVGCCLMALAIVPLSLQEPASTEVLNVACMASPWLLSVGFVLTFSALFSKTWRLNKLFSSGEGFRRVRLRPLDVIVPLAAMMSSNVAVLISWTIVAPLVWVRVPVTNNVDSFGRYPDSFGSCYWNSKENNAYLFLIAVLVVDGTALVFANYQSYLARNIPTDFSESFYVTVSVAGLLEATILGGPIAYLVRDNPTAYFLVLSILISIVCLVILLPMFVPKFILRNIYQRRPNGRGRRASMALSHASRTSRQHEQLCDESSRSVASSVGTSKVIRTAQYFELMRPTEASGTGSGQGSPKLRRRSVAFGDVTLIGMPFKKSSQGSHQEGGGSVSSIEIAGEQSHNFPSDTTEQSTTDGNAREGEG